MWLFSYLHFGTTSIPCLRWTMTLIAIAMYTDATKLFGMNCNHYNTVFETCHFSTNCMDAVSLHKSWLNQYLRDFREYLIKCRLHFIKNLEKERCKYSNIRQNTVQRLHEKVTRRENSFKLYCILLVAR